MSHFLYRSILASAVNIEPPGLELVAGSRFPWDRVIEVWTACNDPWATSPVASGSV